jgi:hypothetical protein
MFEPMPGICRCDGLQCLSDPLAISRADLVGTWGLALRSMQRLLFRSRTICFSMRHMLVALTHSTCCR